MKIIPIYYDYESRSDALCRFVALGDIHYGNPWQDEERLFKTVKWIEENPCYVILMGDYGEAINAKDPRHDYNALHPDYMTPDKQYDRAAEVLAPIKDKVICVLDGNHENNFWRRHNHNYTSQLAKSLGCLDKYAGMSAYIRFRFRRKTGKKARDVNVFNIFAHHGWSGGRTAGYQVKVIHDLNRIYSDAHTYLMGHVHALGEAKTTVRLYVDKRDKPREYLQRYFFTGSYIRGHAEGKGSYVEARAYEPTMLGSPIIEVKPNRIDGRRYERPHFGVRYSTLEWM